MTQIELENLLRRNNSNNVSRNRDTKSTKFYNNNNNTAFTFLNLKKIKDKSNSNNNLTYKISNSLFTNKNSDNNSESINNSKISNFQKVYSKLRKTKVNYMPREVNTSSNINESMTQRPRIKLYNKIFYNKMNFINKNIIKKNSSIKTRNKMFQQNSETNIAFESNKMYKSIFDK